ncbi:MAG: SlyX family protein [Methylococcaceae bacterium]|nr:SlyX family protein [Methylococcaceae bacterium]
MGSDRRLIEIETKLAFQEEAIQTLNEVLCGQQKQIAQMEVTIKLLIDRIKQLLADAETHNKPVDERPPHY